MRLRRRSFALALIAVAAAGTAGCVSLPWELPDPYRYGSGSGASSPYYSSGSGVYGYGSTSGYYGYPYYYSYRQDAPYPGHLYYPYPQYSYPSYPGHYCWDNDRDGRCDRRHDRDDDDQPGHGGGGDDDGGKGDGAGPRLGERPFKDVRRYFQEREQADVPAGSGTRPNPAVVTPAPAPVKRPGTAPALRTPPRTDKAPPRAEPPRASPEAPGPARRAPREDVAPRGPRSDDFASRRSLR